jgi:predicted nuclease of restriction endonuclease-like RecB superfamily
MFAADFARAAPQWDLVGEPEPVLAGDRLIFPDFAIEHRRFPERRWLLEIAGFWTRAYLTEKLGRLRSARIDRLILCVPRAAACSPGELPAEAEIVSFHRRIDVAEVLARVEAPFSPR